MSDDKPMRVSFIPDRWNGGVDGLSNAAEYVHFRLCQRMWATGRGVPRSRAAMVCRGFPETDAGIEELLEEGKLFEVDGMLFNSRAIDEHDRAVDLQEKAVRSGKAGAAAKAKKRTKSSTSGDYDTTQSSDACSDACSDASATPSPSPSPCTNGTTTTLLEDSCARETPAAAVVAAWGEAGREVYGDRWMALPNVTDLHDAGKMIEAGLRPCDALGIFRPILAKHKSAGHDPPSKLRWAMRPTLEAVNAGAGAAITKARSRRRISDVPELQEKLKAARGW